MILILDNFDSFTYNLVDYFHRLGVESIVKRNNLPLGHIMNDRYDGVVLSPGPGAPEQAGCLMQVVNYCVNQQIPLLGVCLGHQAIGLHFGATLVKALKPMHGKVSTIRIDTEDPLFKDCPEQFDVVRYHSLIVKDFGRELKPLGETQEGEIMALAHENLPIRGLQYHPEAELTNHGLHVLGNWVHYFTCVR